MPEVKMSSDPSQPLLDQGAAFNKNFGREPGLQGPVLIDPSEDVPTLLSPERMKTGISGAVREAGFDEAKIDAFLKGMR